MSAPDTYGLLPVTWWNKRRKLYNIGLVLAGILGFCCYAVAVDRCIDLHVPGDWEVSGFTTLFQGVLYMFVILIANLFYSLGAWSERLIQPKNVQRYRKIMFGLGFGFSMLLLFVPAVNQFILCSHSSK